MLPTMFWFIWQSGFREDFLEINQSETIIACAAMFVNGSERNEQFNKGPSKDASYQV